MNRVECLLVIGHGFLCDHTTVLIHARLDKPFCELSSVTTMLFILNLQQGPLSLILKNIALCMPYNKSLFFINVW